MLPIYSFDFVLTVVFAVFFYRAGEFEGTPALLWSVLSVAVSLLMWLLLRWGLLGIILGQICLFVGIGVVRALQKSE